jgi:tRNA pseudouridine32 synthase / 23S rRNA pseudouridine746 synthase
MLYPLSDFIDKNCAIANSPPNYYYEGICPHSGELLKLPRTALAEAIARGLMKSLAKENCYPREGKMYGVLLVELPSGEQKVLKAFSGLLNGCSTVEGWIPPIPGREQVVLEESRTLAQLEAIKQEITTLLQLPERQQYETLSRDFERQLQKMSDRHQQRKQLRQEKRQVASRESLQQLDEESRQDGLERKDLKRQRDRILQPLKDAIATADTKIRTLKQQRKELSRQLQAQMHAAYSLINFLGQSRSLQQLLPKGLPTGTGDCCAPKLLHYAAMHNLKPLSMAEFWWGDASGDKIAGNFYGACQERCQPLMGFLLSGSDFSPLPSFLYEDEWIIAVNKPAGLLSVPGRYYETQDSILSRLRHRLPDGKNLIAVHRLDLETSGILLIARNLDVYRHLSQQFQQRQVGKIYEAVLAGCLKCDRGIIELPLWGNPQNRPYQQVDWQQGKASVTHFQVLDRQQTTRVEFMPLTGRTHQLRVHSADARGLAMPILGDKLYGCLMKASRLHLHARELSFEHPQLEKTLHLQVKTPF